MDLVRFSPSLVIPGLVNLVAVPLLIGQLGLSQYGKWVLIWTTGQSVPVLGTHWLEASIIRYSHLPGEALSQTVSRLAAASVLGSAAIGAVAIRILVPGATAIEIGSGAALTAAVGWYLVALAALVGQRRFGRYSFISIARSVGGAGAAVVAATLTRDVAVSIAAAAIALAVGAIGSRAGILRRRGRIDRRAVRQIADFGVPSAIIAAASLVVSVADRYILAAYWPLAIVGTYSAIYAVVDLTMRLIPTAVGSVARPTVFRLWDAAGMDEGSAMVARLTAITAVIAAIAACAVAGAGTIALDWLGGTWAASRPAFAAILAGAYMQAVATVANIAFGGGRRQWAAGVNMVLAAVTNVLLNLIFVPNGAIMAAALATTAAYGVLLVLTLARVQPAVKRALSRRPLGIITVAPMAVVGIVLSAAGLGWSVLVVTGLGIGASLLMSGALVVSPSARSLLRTVTDPLIESPSAAIGA